MSIYNQSWFNVLPANTDSEGPTTGMIRVSVEGGGGNGALNYPIIFEQYQVQLNEKVQFLECFKEFIHAYAFGKALGQATIAGSVLATPQNPRHRNFKNILIRPYDSTLRAFQLAKAGKLAIVSGPGTNIVKGVITNLSYSIAGQQSSVVKFSMNLAIVSSSLGVT